MSKGVILLNGTPPGTGVFPAEEKHFIVCADGAYDWACQYGIVPDIVLGDMDSHTVSIPQNIPKMIFPTDKDFTDGEIAMRYLLEHGYRDIDIYAAVGRRDDHQLANYGLLYYAMLEGANARIITDYTDIYIANGFFHKKLPLGTILSVVPFSTDAHIMNTEGLKYRVRDKVMHAYGSLGISNVVTGGWVEIEIACGTVLIFVVKRTE